MTSPVAQELMGQYLDLILEANKTTNLTRITSRNEALVLHIEDSLVGLEEVSEAPEGLYGDLFFRAFMQELKAIDDFPVY